MVVAVVVVGVGVVQAQRIHRDVLVVVIMMVVVGAKRVIGVVAGHSDAEAEAEVECRGRVGVHGGLLEAVVMMEVVGEGGLWLGLPGEWGAAGGGGGVAAALGELVGGRRLRGSCPDCGGLLIMALAVEVVLTLAMAVAVAVRMVQEVGAGALGEEAVQAGDDTAVGIAAGSEEAHLHAMVAATVDVRSGGRRVGRSGGCGEHAKQRGFVHGRGHAISSGGGETLVLDMRRGGRGHGGVGKVLAVRVCEARLALHHCRGRHHGRGRLGLGSRGVLADALSLGFDDCPVLALDVPDAAAWLGLVLVLFGFRLVFPLPLGDTTFAGCGGAVPALRLDAQHGRAESRVSHASGMAVGDGLGEDGAAGHLIPVDLVIREAARQFCGRPRVPTTNPSPAGISQLTSLRHFCCRIANKKRAITLSLFAMMMVLLASPRPSSRCEGEEEDEKRGQRARK